MTLHNHYKSLAALTMFIHFPGYKKILEYAVDTGISNVLTMSKMRNSDPPPNLNVTKPCVLKVQDEK